MTFYKHLQAVNSFYLDALVDFTQLQVKTEHREKTEHSAACWQLKQMESGVSISSTLGMMVYFSAYFVFHAWIAASQFKKADWKHSQQQAFELSKLVFTNAPVRLRA